MKKGNENLFSLILCLIVMTVFAAVTWFFNYIWAITEFVCVILLAVMSFVFVRREHGKISSYIENITFHVDNVTKECLIEAPMPVAIFRNDDGIIWTNDSFDEIFEGKDLFGTSAEKLLGRKNFIADLFSKGKLQFDITFGEKHYNVCANAVKQDKKDVDLSFGVIYMFDDSTTYELAKKYYNEQPTVAIISVDNYDDVLINTPESYRSMFIAEIDNKIYDWFKEAGCVIKKYERDKYLVVFPREFLEVMKARKFSILDEVKEIKCGNKFSATLSIGVGCDAPELSLRSEYAASATNLALGRGGDQAVIKDDENVNFYGGKTREHEKTTKVRARVTALALKELILHASNVIIMGHKYADMDSIGAAVGVHAIAKSLGKEAYIVYDYTSPSVNSIVSRIKENTDYKNMIISKQDANGYIDESSLVVVVDTHRPAYTECPSLLENECNVVLIDHHRRGEEFVENAALVYHEPYASSTCEMVAELLQYVGDKLKVSAFEAEALYAGIMVDTKDFSMKTGVRTFEAAAYLKRCGVNISEIRKFFRNDFNSFVLISKIVTDAEIVNNNIAISVFKTKNGADVRTIAAQAADKLVSVSGIEASFVIVEEENESSVSGRSGGNINVQIILEKLGGGGHQTIAGAQIKNMSGEEVKTKLLEEIAHYFSEQE